VKKILTASGLRVFLTIFSPFILTIVIMFFIESMGLGKTLGWKIKMTIYSIYPYAQMYVLLHWTKILSTEIFEKIEFKNEVSIDRFNKFYRISIWIVYLCFGLSLINIIFGDYISQLPKPIIIGIASLAIIQIFLFVTLFYGFYTTAKLIRIHEEKRPKPSDTTGTFILFWFLPFTISGLQKRIRKIMTENTIAST